MNGLTIIFLVAAVFGIGFLLWMKTKSGKKWLNSL